MDKIPTAWKIYSSTQEALSGVLDSCAKATSSIYIEQFLFTPDTFTHPLIELLIKKAQSGVTVKCVFDSLGSYSLGGSVECKALIDAGVQIKFFNWMLPFSKNNKKFWYFRNHRRLVLIDRETLLIGGVCMSNTMQNWRETHMRIEGPVVGQAVNVFDMTWKRVYRKHSLRLGAQYKTGIDGFSYITHAPLPAERHLYYRLIDAIRNAKTSVYLTTPYFLPDRRLTRVILLARRRGVDVRILVPAHSDHYIVDIGAHTFFQKFLSQGVRLFLYQNMIHAKTASIDNDWSMVGTLNLDNVSLRYNFESGIIGTVPSFTDELKEMFNKDMQGSHEVTLSEWQARPFLQRLAELIVWPIRKFL